MEKLTIFTVVVGIVLLLNLLLSIRRWLKFYGGESYIDNKNTEDTGCSSVEKQKVMVVDDSLTKRTVVSKLLTESGYNVLTEPSGEAALIDLEEYSPDIVLLDIEMPRMGGYEAAAMIRKNQKLSSIPIIMVSPSSSITRKQKDLSEFTIISGNDDQSILQTVRKHLRTS